MKRAGIWTLLIGLALVVVTAVSVSFTDDSRWGVTGNAIVSVGWLLILVGLVLWIVGKVQQRKT